MPPYYLQRFIWRYLQINNKDSKWGLHFLQACNAIKEKNLAALNWWISLDAALTGFGLINLTCEQSKYVLALDDDYMIMILSTDDYPFLYCNSSTFHWLISIYVKICLSSYIVGANLPVFIDLNCGSWYTNSNLHLTIMFPRGAGLSGMNLILCTYGNGQFNDNIMYKGMRLFVDADHARVVFDIRSIYFILFNFLGFTVHCKFVKQPFINTHSTDLETSAFYIVTKMEDYICHILYFLCV